MLRGFPLSARYSWEGFFDPGGPVSMDNKKVSTFGLNLSSLCSVGIMQHHLWHSRDMRMRIRSSCERMSWAESLPRAGAAMSALQGKCGRSSVPSWKARGTSQSGVQGGHSIGRSKGDLMMNAQVVWRMGGVLKRATPSIANKCCRTCLTSTYSTPEYPCQTPAHPRTIHSSLRLVPSNT